MIVLYLIHLRLMEFKTCEGAEKAINTMHRFEIGDRKLVVREETAKDILRISKMEVDGSVPGENQQKLSSDFTAINSLINVPVLNQFSADSSAMDTIYISNVCTHFL